MTVPVTSQAFKVLLTKTNSSQGKYNVLVYKDILRSLINTFSNLNFIDRNSNLVSIKCFHGSQERASSISNVGDNITLPIISISEQGTSNDDARRKYSSIINHEVYWDKSKLRAIRVISFPPRPIDIKYEIGIWTKYKEDIDQIKSQIFIMFNPDLDLLIGEDKLITKCYLDTENVEQTELAEDTKDRVIRTSIAITAKTYLDSPKFLYTSTGKIEEFNNELELVESSVNLELAELNNMDKLYPD